MNTNKPICLVHPVINLIIMHDMFLVLLKNVVSINNMQETYSTSSSINKTYLKTDQHLDKIVNDYSELMYSVLCWTSPQSVSNTYRNYNPVHCHQRSISDFPFGFCVFVFVLFSNSFNYNGPLITTKLNIPKPRVHRSLTRMTPIYLYSHKMTF